MDPKLKKLTGEFFLFIDKLDCDSVRGLRAFYDGKDDEYPIRDLLVFYGDLNHKEKQNIFIRIRDTEYGFVKEVIDTLKNKELLNYKSGKPTSINSYENNTVRFAALVLKYYGLKTIRDFPIEIWKDIQNNIVNSSLAPREGLKEGMITPVRHFKGVISANSNTRYSLNINVKGSNRNQKSTSAEIWKEKDGIYATWITLYESWKHTLNIKNIRSHNTAINYFLTFLDEMNETSEPLVFLSNDKRKCYWAWLNQRSKNELDERYKRQYATIAYEFTEWLIRDNSANFEDSHIVFMPKPLFSSAALFEINRTRVKGEKHFETVKNILPTKWVQLLKTILTENDYAWPKSLDWTWFKKDGGMVWDPTFTHLYRLMLEIPIRKIQAAALDSGEGDDYVWDFKNEKWIPNSGNNSSYWSTNYKEKFGRGVIRRDFSGKQESTVLYINTNKTQDKDKGFGSDSGYTIKWHNPDIISIINEMREWQEANNPIVGPTSYRSLPSNTFSDNPTERVKDSIPDRFYLFRSPSNNEAQQFSNQAPPADYLLFKFWHYLMNELETRLRAQGEDIKITLGWSGKHPNKSVFTPHGLRATGITAFFEAGVPIEVLSKIVAGHAVVLHTLHYVKFHSAHITQILNSARLKSEREEQGNFNNFLKQDAWDDVYKYSAFNHEETLKNVWMNGTSTMFENRQIGTCPNSGTLCDIGGEPIRQDRHGGTTFGMVPGGSGNCVRCRFFITGAPFLAPLWLKVNKDLADAHKQSKELAEIDDKYNALLKERYVIKKEHGASAITQELNSNIKQHESLIDKKTRDLDMILNNAHAGSILLEKVKELISENYTEESFPAMLDTGSRDKDEWLEVAEFTKNDFLVQASRHYPFIKDEEVEMRRNHFLDQVMFNIGMAPITLSPLSKKEKEMASDMASKYLTMKLSQKELHALETNSITLEQLGIGKELKNGLSNPFSDNNFISLEGE